MLIAQLFDATPVWAEPGATALCPGCHAPVIAKCGDVMPWHWSHMPGALAECDSWTEPETEWHLNWKMRALDAGCEVEVTMREGTDWHRADIVRPDGVIVEVQHSGLGIGEAHERETFYRAQGGLIWVFDARERWWPSVGFEDGHMVWRNFSRTAVDLWAPQYWDTTDGLLAVTIEGMGWDYARLVVRQADASELFDPLVSPVQTTLVAASLLPPSKAWTVLPRRCATCGANPHGTFNDGSPRYSCPPHTPIYPEIAA